MAAADLELVELPDANAWEHWLETHHESSPGVWLALAKKGSTRRTVAQSEAVELALCFGWIDGQVGRIDAERYRQRFTPRRPRSRWSLLNTQKVEALIAAGRMRPAGLTQVQAARADGRWESAYRQAGAELPADLAAAIAAEPTAQRHFDGLAAQDRFAFIFRLGQPGSDATRQARIRRYVEMLAAGRSFHGETSSRSGGGA